MKPTTPHAIRSQEEVAAILGISQSEVATAERRALRKLFYALQREAKDEGFDTSKGPVAKQNQPRSGRKKERK